MGVRGREGAGGAPVEGEGEDAVGEAEGLLHAVAVVRVHVHVRHPPEAAQEPHDGQHRVVDLRRRGRAGVGHGGRRAGGRAGGRART